MFLYIITMIEPTENLPEDQREGGSFVLTLGGLPGSEYSTGPWNDTQQKQVKQAVKEWYEYTPEQITKEHKVSRDNVLLKSKGNDYLFLVDYDHYMSGEPQALMDDMHKLYEVLTKYCTPHKMTVTQFMSF